MKAAVYDQAGPPDVLTYRDVADPIVGPDDVLIAVEAISIEGGDLINRRSTPPPGRPWIVGYAASGRVVGAGANVRDRKVGDRVTAFDMQGSHAELWAVPAIRTWLLPSGVDAASAAALPISFGTAHHCLFCQRWPSAQPDGSCTGSGGWSWPRRSSARGSSRRNRHRRLKWRKPAAKDIFPWG